jgi:hypothetical protein
MIRICKHCQSPFRPHYKVPDQKYCSSRTCQKARRREWQKQKLQEDDAYKENQRDAQLAWQKKNPDYWRNYRNKHPDYVERNRRMQKKRNYNSRHGRNSHDAKEQMIAKMDEIIEKSNVNSVYYRLYPIIVGI